MSTEQPPPQNLPFPPELVIQILSHLRFPHIPASSITIHKNLYCPQRNSTLLSFALVCREWSPIALEELYRHLELPWLASTAPRVLACFEAKPTLCRLPRTVRAQFTNATRWSQDWIDRSVEGRRVSEVGKRLFPDKFEESREETRRRREAHVMNHAEIAREASVDNQWMGGMSNYGIHGRFAGAEKFWLWLSTLSNLSSVQVYDFDVPSSSERIWPLVQPLLSRLKSLKAHNSIIDLASLHDSALEVLQVQIGPFCGRLDTLRLSPKLLPNLTHLHLSWENGPRESWFDVLSTISRPEKLVAIELLNPSPHFIDNLVDLMPSMRSLESLTIIGTAALSQLDNPRAAFALSTLPLIHLSISLWPTPSLLRSLPSSVRSIGLSYMKRGEDYGDLERQLCDAVCWNRDYGMPNLEVVEFGPAIGREQAFVEVISKRPLAFAELDTERDEVVVRKMPLLATCPTHLAPRHQLHLEPTRRQPSTHSPASSFQRMSELKPSPLPSDIVVEILQFALEGHPAHEHPVLLTTFALVSPQFRSCANRILYCDLKVQWVAGTALRLLRSLRANPSLGRMTKSLAVLGISESDWQGQWGDKNWFLMKYHHGVAPWNKPSPAGGKAEPLLTPEDILAEMEAQGGGGGGWTEACVGAMESAAARAWDTEGHARWARWGSDVAKEDDWPKRIARPRVARRLDWPHLDIEELLEVLNYLPNVGNLSLSSLSHTELPRNHLDDPRFSIAQSHLAKLSSVDFVNVHGVFAGAILENVKITFTLTLDKSQIWAGKHVNMVPVKACPKSLTLVGGPFGYHQRWITNMISPDTLHSLTFTLHPSTTTSKSEFMLQDWIDILR
ncbi:hypothetical protein P7C70_g8707, partial [Phenoliferia sp. Uapishka_3]